MESNNGLGYLNSLSKKMERDLSKQPHFLSDISNLADRQLIENMITFNPYFRSSAKECLDALGGSEINKINFKKVKLEIDRDESYDYSSGESAIYS